MADVQEDRIKIAVQAAVRAAPDVNDLTKAQINQIAENMPPPQAMEKMTWQNIRSLIMILGGVGVATGVIASNEELQALIKSMDTIVIAITAISSAVAVIAPPIYRNWTSFSARWRARSG